jgi:hypothetical protein
MLKLAYTEVDRVWEVSARWVEESHSYAAIAPCGVLKV